MSYYNDFTPILNKIPTKIETDYDEIRMEFDDGSVATWYHCQDCCETVSIEDVAGDWNDLIGVPLLECYESHDTGGADYGDTYTYTYYNYRSINGHVNVRWYGTSNGYYSETVDFKYYNPKNN